MYGILTLFTMQVLTVIVLFCFRFYSTGLRQHCSQMPNQTYRTAQQQQQQKAMSAIPAMKRDAADEREMSSAARNRRALPCAT